ncbi:MAG: response regulator [Magnetococcales bacterium]|nr:response regulator [Magnetococcales bacterium]
MDRENKILVVDPNQEMLHLYEQNLNEIGYEVVPSRSGSDALAMFEVRRPELVILDACLSTSDGLSTCAALRQRADEKELSILVVTPQEDNTSVIQAFAAGADDFITKPVHWGVLFQRMRHLLRGVRAHRQELQNQVAPFCEETARHSLVERILAQEPWIDIWADCAFRLQPWIYNSQFMKF